MPSPMPLVEPVTIADLPASALVDSAALVGEVIIVMGVTFARAEVSYSDTARRALIFL